jgi:Flp pilus assembly protein TadD
MIVRLSSQSARLTLLCVSGVFAGSLAFFSIRNARAQYLAESQAPPGLDRAVQLEPGNARNWFLLGHYWQYNLEQRDTARAITFYKIALSLDPHSPSAWLDLGEAFETEGDLKSARAAFLRAKENYPISAEVAWRYGNFLLRQGELPAAYREIYRSLKAEPGRAAAAVSVCWRAAPEIQPILDSALPASRDVYLSAIAVLVREQETEPALAVWKRLAVLRPQLQMEDVAKFLEVLVAKGDIADAREVWAQSLSFAGISRPDDPAGSLIWDGGFESDVNVGFGWRIQPVSGAQISFDASVKHSGSRALRVRFDGTQNVNFEHVCQSVAVDPGSSYQFSAWMRADAVTTDRGVFFRLGTPELPGTPPAMTPELRGTEPWTRVTLPLKTGKDVHLVQVCLARMPSEKLDNKIAGTIWVDDVSLLPDTLPAPVSGGARPGKPRKKERP